MKTTVIFYKEGNEVLAVFPYDQPRHGQVACYAHIGQHSAASVEFVEKLKRAKKVEYSALKNELERIGYKLNVL